MANTAAAKKAMRSSARRAVANRAIRSAVKTRVTRARRALLGDSGEETQQLATAALASLDRAASKGVLHANNAARRKSRLQRRLNAAAAGELTHEPTKGSRGRTTAEKPTKGAKAATKAAAKAPAAKKPAARKTTKPAKS